MGFGDFELLIFKVDRRFREVDIVVFDVLVLVVVMESLSDWV